LFLKDNFNVYIYNTYQSSSMATYVFLEGSHGLLYIQR